MLLKFGADRTLRISTFFQTPIFVAAKFGNTETFRELMKGHPGCLSKDVDGQGWTFLHVAVWFKCFDIASLLLDAGADPHCESSLCRSHKNPRLNGRVLTTWDVAQVRGEGATERYCQILRMHGYDVELDSDGEAYWDVRN